jgi:hypothetical protein
MAAGRPERGISPQPVERRIYIDASPDTVWRALHADPTLAGAASGEDGATRRRPTARLALVRPGSAGPGWPAAGAQRPGRLHLGPARLAVTLESLEARPARRFRVGISCPSVDGEARWELAPAAGGTRVACTLRLGGRSRVGRLCLWLGRRGLPRRLEAELAELKRAAEGGRTPA